MFFSLPKLGLPDADPAGFFIVASTRFHASAPGET
jgi:hypothetical protein